MTSKELINNFKSNASKVFNSDLKKVRGQVFEVTGQFNCLFYIKTRTTYTNWGITKNVIDRLKNQNRQWFVLLLSSPPHPNYFLTANDVNNYIKQKWALNPDGDYKTTTIFPDDKQFATARQLKNKIGTPRQTALIANSDLQSDKLYLQRARAVLPYLVRQANAGQTIFYSDLAQEVGIPNPRNLNYVLGAIGNALIKLGNRTKTAVPPIQCLVINKQTNFPGDGIDGFMDKKEFSILTRSEKTEVLNRALTLIFSFQKWDWVLQQLQLLPIQADIKPEIEKAKRYRYGGESPFHLSFKNYIASNPKAIGLTSSVGIGQTEYCLPSADSVDIVFLDINTTIGVEVKSKISDSADILRGLFQCVKYKHLIEAEQKVKGKRPDSRVILVLEGQLPIDLQAIKNILGIEVMDKIKNGA